MTKNEERVISRTLNSVRDFGQVFVVDSGSTDRTVEIAHDAGAVVLDYRWNGRYPKKKEWSLLNLPFEYDWVLYLDADEAVEGDLVAELKRRFAAPARVPFAAFDVDLRYHFLRRELRYGHRVTKRVLVNRHLTTWPRVDDLGISTMWEVEGHYQPQVDGPVGKLSAKFTHDDRDPLYDYFARHNRYSDWEAHLKARSTTPAGGDPNQHRSRGGQIFARIPAKPLVFFIYSYLLRLGFLDGFAGLHYAVAHSFYFWQIDLKARELTAARHAHR
ncbi:glycosyltransferase family 2 protein [Cryptosporangium sp. NPDC048952]|uniref:glycosyltransferase family 2 protein n=1 Tax=Cryptosporangium sp. NPDC048952 TaxID=3363961 RepID=UPI003721EB7D